MAAQPNRRDQGAGRRPRDDDLLTLEGYDGQGAIEELPPPESRGRASPWEAAPSFAAMLRIFTRMAPGPAPSNTVSVPCPGLLASPPPRQRSPGPLERIPGLHDEFLAGPKWRWPAHQYVQGVDIVVSAQVFHKSPRVDLPPCSHVCRLRSPSLRSPPSSWDGP